MSLIHTVHEYGYEQAALGFSLSYNTTIERAKELMPRYAWGTVPGENKFLRVINLWIDCRLPRFMWQEADQYKVSATTLSESTVHTLKRRMLNSGDFVANTSSAAIDNINCAIAAYQGKFYTLAEMKANLPEGFLQRRIWHMNYATLQNIIAQRSGHPVRLWRDFIDEIMPLVEHPEFVRKSQAYPKS